MSESTSLKSRVLKSGGWVVAGYVLSQVIRLGSNLILTRLLFPEAFGLMAVVVVLITAMNLFSDMGVDVSIIQNRRGDDPEFLNTAWVVKVLRGFIIWAIALLVAKILPFAVSMHWFPVHSVYANPMLPSLIAIEAIALLTEGFASTKLGLARRKVQLERITKIDLLGQVVALPVMVIWAWWYHSIWALVGGSVVNAVVRCLLSHVWLPGVANRFQWNQKYFSEIFHFGKYIFLLSILGFLLMNGDRLILGDLLSASQLGIYSIAFILNSAVLGLYTSIMQKLLFPVISEVINHNQENTAKIYKKLQGISDLGLFFSSGFLYVAGAQIVMVLYDSRYHEAGGMLSILAISLIGVRYSVVEQLIMAKGQIKYLLLSRVIRIITMYIGILLGFIIYGLNGALYAIVISYFSGWPVAIYYKKRHHLTNWKWELFAWPVFSVGAGAGWLFRHFTVWITG